MYVRDLLSNITTLVSENNEGGISNGNAGSPEFDANCQRISFESVASDLLDSGEDDTSHVFVRDLRTNTTILASEADDGSPAGNSVNSDISPDGSLVAFISISPNLPDAQANSLQVYIRNLTSRQTIPVSRRFDNLGTDIAGFGWPFFSPDGRYLIFRSLTDPTDTSKRGRHVMVWDVQRQTSAILGIDAKTPTGWSDACTTGPNNGTSFSAEMSDPVHGDPYYALFTAVEGKACRLVLRDLSGNDIPVEPENPSDLLIEPAINATGDVLAWSNSTQNHHRQVYSCNIDRCR